jgi:Spy/CpxP family protein refolding chaperone
VLSRVGASDAQRQQVKGIVAQAHADVASLRDQHLQNRQAFLERLTQPAVDRAGLEQLRQAELALADKASARLVKAVADVGDVLTPDQRTALVQHLERFHRH